MRLSGRFVLMRSSLHYKQILVRLGAQEILSQLARAVVIEAVGRVVYTRFVSQRMFRGHRNGGFFLLFGPLGGEGEKKRGWR